MLKSGKTPWLLIAAGIFILLKWLYTLADDGQLLFMLQPVDYLVGIMTGSPGIYTEGKGFYHDTLHITIGKSCSGFNFMLICFALLTFVLLKYVKRYRAVIPLALLMAYFINILVNASRIFVSILVQRQAGHFLPDRPHYILHEVTGVAINLGFLTLMYLFLEKYLSRRYAKLT